MLLDDYYRHITNNEELVYKLYARKQGSYYAHGVGELKLIYTGRILVVGISYDKEAKEHSCKVEVLEFNVYK